MIVPSPATDSGGSGPPRPTIADVARAAGVSIAVVSYALNGRPGVSTATRERVLRVADELGWRPSAAARSVRGGPRAVGLAVTGEPGGIARTTSFLDFLTAATDGLGAGGLSLAVQVAGSADVAIDLYRTWRAERRFDVLVVPDLLVEDPRVDVLRWMHAPAVLLGLPGVVEGMAAVCFDEADAGSRLATYLVELGHERIAAVTAPMRMQATQVRLAALRGVVGDRVLTHLATNATPEGAAAATRALLTEPDPPSAIVYDTDQMAVVGLDVARRLGVEVPWDLSIVAGSDSELCRLATPTITALPMPMADLGAATARAVLALLGGEVDVAAVVPVGALAVRGSTGPRVIPGA